RLASRCTLHRFRRDTFHHEGSAERLRLRFTHMPLVEDTTGIINKETLAEFKDGAFLINTSRARICVEEDVAQALRSGKLGGFATDVWFSDPPENSPLFDAPNTIFTPHVGASTNENMLRIGVVIERIIGEYVESKKKAGE
ncbi:MAG: NAD(P)-dependent oxidoreductase, partial [Candidatus Zixiibacteriota bacterium]